MQVRSVSHPLLGRRWVGIALTLAFAGTFIILSTFQAARIPKVTATPEAAAKILWFVLEGDTSTLAALAKGQMLVQRLPHITADSITSLELLLSTIGDVSGITYHLKLFDPKNREIFSTVLPANEIVANSYNRVRVAALARPLRNERVSLVLYSDNAEGDRALTAYFTRSHPQGAFFIVPYDGATRVEEILANLNRNPANKRVRGSINLNLYGN